MRRRCSRWRLLKSTLACVFMTLSLLLCHMSLSQSPTREEGRYKGSGQMVKRMANLKMSCSGGRRRDKDQLKWRLTDLVCTKVRN